MQGAGSNGTGNGAAAAPAEPRLRGWKEIGRWFGVDERTVKRWEATRGLPIHRVPGEARAPVFAYPAELSDWLKSRGPSGPIETSPLAMPAPAAPDPRPRRRPGSTALALLAVLALAVAAWAGWRSAGVRRQEARDRTADVRLLARSRIAELSDRLEKQPGTVGLRAALAGEAAAVLARVAAQPDAGPALRREAAEAYRLLAIVQSATDRPSLRDRQAARASLDKALALIAADGAPAARPLRAQLLIDAARHAAADGAVARAPALLAEAARNADPLAPPLRDELALARSEVAQWQGDYRRAIASAEAVYRDAPAGPADWLRQVRARDLAAEARYYAGNKAGALAGYRAALAVAEAGRRRFPAEPALRWAVQRQQWNLGTTLSDSGAATAALPMLAASRDGWLAMARADPEDQSLAAWVRTTRLSYGEGLRVAGRTAAAIAELSQSVADRRAWAAALPASAERQRALVVGLNALADVLAAAGRQGEACGVAAEAQAVVARMAAAGALTALDRGSIVAELARIRKGRCEPATPGA